MKECRTDGDLRAYHDRELEAYELERAAAHLAACPECAARYREIAARADRVADALAALGNAPPRGRRLWPRWAAAAAVAATVALALLRPVPPAPRAPGPFVALDNEPIDAGVVMRVSLGPNNVQADVIVSADGRVRAYRLVQDSSSD